MLERMLEGASDRGVASVVTGEAGIGKSRLLREAAAGARAAGSLVMHARASAISDPPYRPFAEALLDADRAGELPDSIELGVFRDLIALLLPTWRREGVLEATPDLLGEAMLRLLSVAAGERRSASLLVMDDFQWADHETATAIDYMARHAQPRVVIWLARRPGEGEKGPHIADALVRDRVANSLVLHRLPRSDVEAMVAACGGRADASVVDASEGVPFLVEELLATGGDVPRLFRDTVATRLASLGEDATSVLIAAALLGKQFDWLLLPAATGRPVELVGRSLAAAVDRQLLIADGAGYSFRHALTREAILQLGDPAERHSIATRLLVSASNADGLGSVQPALVARIALEARRPGDAAAWYAAAARQALMAGALTTAEAAFRDALSLQHDRQVVLELADVLTRAGRHDAATRVLGDELSRAVLASEPAHRLARLHVELARAAIAGDRFGEAAHHVAQSREIGSEMVEPAVTVADAAVELARGHLTNVHELAERAVREAISRQEWDAACQALELDGRAARQRGDPQARIAFARAREIARGAGLVIAELRALHELGTVEMLDRGDVSFLEEARELAERCFALSTMTVLDLQLAAGYHLIADLDKSLSAAERSSDIARRLRLHVVEAMQLLLAAHVHAARLDAHAAEDALERARAAAPAVLTIEGLAWSFVRSILALLKGDVEFARSALDKGMGYLRLDPTSPPAHCRGLWALVRAVDDDAGEAAIEEVAASGACINFANRAHLSLARAVVLGRSGEGATASKLAEKGRAALAPLWRHLVAQLIAPPALDGDWGAPLEWLREADEFFATSGYGEAASAVRALLRRAGARVPRGGRSAGGVPPTLAPLGVTAREAEVLRLVAEGLPNRAIAARLFISPRTVEKHIERLVEKTDVSSRTELVAYANRLR